MENVAHRGIGLSWSRGRLLLLLAAGALVIMYAVGFDPTVHELMHDGRHLLGIPCH